MQHGVITVGTDAVIVPVVAPLQKGLRLLGRAANTNVIYVGTSSSVTTSTGNLVPKGDPGTSNPYTVPKEHYDGGRTIYVIAGAASQVLDWSAE